MPRNCKCGGRLRPIYTHDPRVAWFQCGGCKVKRSQGKRQSKA